MLELETHYLNVGQGDCTLIVFRDNSRSDNKKKYDNRIVQTVVFDCGSSSDQLAGRALLAKCADLRVKRIDVAVISHFDKDHFNGFIWLLGETGSMVKNSVNQLFGETVFYTQGSIHRSTKPETPQNWIPDTYLSTRGVVHGYSKPRVTNGKQYDALEFYVDFLKKLQKFSKRTGNKLEYVTERVISGYPNPHEPILSGERFVEADTWWPVDASSDRDDVNFPDFVKVNFEEHNFLLGKDLLKEDFLSDYPGVGLKCIAYNGHVDGTSFLWAAKTTDKDGKIANNRSIGCVLQFYDYTAWFGGDLEKEIEDKCVPGILSMNPLGLSVLKAGHHGSKNSTSDKFLGQTNPEVVVISCGEGTKNTINTDHEKSAYGHPSIETVIRLVAFFKTDKKKLGVFTTWSPRTKEYINEGVPFFRGQRRRFKITESTISISLSESDAIAQPGNKPAFDLETTATYKEFRARKTKNKIRITSSRNFKEVEAQTKQRLKKRKENIIRMEVLMREEQSEYDRFEIVSKRIGGSKKRKRTQEGTLSDKRRIVKKRRIEGKHHL